MGFLQQLIDLQAETEKINMKASDAVKARYLLGRLLDTQRDLKRVQEAVNTEGSYLTIAGVDVPLIEDETSWEQAKLLAINHFQRTEALVRDRLAKLGVGASEADLDEVREMQAKGWNFRS